MRAHCIVRFEVIVQKNRAHCASPEDLFLFLRSCCLTTVVPSPPETLIASPATLDWVLNGCRFSDCCLRGARTNSYKATRRVLAVSDCIINQCGDIHGKAMHLLAPQQFIVLGNKCQYPTCLLCTRARKLHSRPTYFKKIAKRLILIFVP